jgi:hypothetical protein
MMSRLQHAKRLVCLQHIVVHKLGVRSWLVGWLHALTSQNPFVVLPTTTAYVCLMGAGVYRQDFAERRQHYIDHAARIRSERREYTPMVGCATTPMGSTSPPTCSIVKLAHSRHAVSPPTKPILLRMNVLINSQIQSHNRNCNRTFALFLLNQRLSSTRIAKWMVPLLLRFGV